MAFQPHKARAQCCNCADEVNVTSNAQWFASGSGTVDVITNHLDAEFNAQEIWMISVLLEDNILPAMMLMAEQLTVVAMNQVQIFGSFLDAKHQNETIRLFQKLQAEAHKDYHPSVGMCEFGSATKSLAASERKGEIAAITLSQRSLDRQLGSPNTSGQYGVNLDKESRVAQFKSVFCYPLDQNNGLWQMCRGTPSTDPPAATGAAAVRERFNKDIDFTRTVDVPWTLEVDFTDNTLTQAEEEVLALAANLYTHDVFERPAAADLASPADGRVDAALSAVQKAYMDMRSLVAKRSVAESSYNAIVGMKSAGTAGSRDYLLALLQNLGVVHPPSGTFGGPLPGPTDSIDYLLGDNPSYYAQMEVLTKKIYQNPDFFTNLYDKPANVKRKEAAIQAIGLMQKFDMFKSYLRSEASLSILLELAVIKLQKDVENEINVGDDSGNTVLP
ncbi:MAG: hypothetical protein ACLFR0_08290 [Alphaproteobacteria bacterium]